MRSPRFLCACLLLQDVERASSWRGCTLVVLLEFFWKGLVLLWEGKKEKRTEKFKVRLYPGSRVYQIVFVCLFVVHHVVWYRRTEPVRHRGAGVRVSLLLHAKVLDAVPLPGSRRSPRRVRHARRVVRGACVNVYIPWSMYI